MDISRTVLVTDTSIGVDPPSTKVVNSSPSSEQVTMGVDTNPQSLISTATSSQCLLGFKSYCCQSSEVARLVPAQVRAQLAGPCVPMKDETCTSAVDRLMVRRATKSRRGILTYKIIND